MTTHHRLAVTSEFTRTAATYALRTASRYESLDPLSRSGVAARARVLEVGGGTGSFLSLFTSVAGVAVDLDLTPEMLREAKRRDPSLVPVQGDGALLPFRARSFDLVACVQMLHHVPEPLPLVKEMRRVVADRGTIMVIDQVATESFEAASIMTTIETTRDPSHAVSRPPSAIKALLLAAGLGIESIEIISERESLDQWMPAREFPAERIAATKQMIENLGHLSGMGFHRDRGDWRFERRRMVVIAKRL